MITHQIILHDKNRNDKVFKLKVEYWAERKLLTAIQHRFVT